MIRASRAGRRRMLHRAAIQQRIEPPLVRTLPAPVRGLNLRDALTDMKPDDAIRLDNWYPGFGSCEIRGGTRLHAELKVEELDENDTPTGELIALSSPVETLAVHNGPNGQRLMAACAGGFWDVTDGGTVSSPIGGNAPYASDRWQTVTMNNKVLLSSGQNTPQTWDGASKALLPVNGPGLAANRIIGCNVFKSRSYFWAGGQDFWYSDVRALGGNVSLFPLADVANFGGFLMFMVNWSRDGGDGQDDVAVFVMSSGDVIVYQGSNPGDADDWAHVGTYKIGEPVNIRAWCKLDGDVLIVTTDGYGLLSRMLPNSRGAEGINISDRIVNGAISAIRAGKDNFGWQAILYPGGRRLMVNHPVGGNFMQHTVNLATGAWCRFRDMDARCWVIFRDKPYFGSSNGQIYEADTGVTDAGRRIIADGRQAYSYFGSPGANKHVTMVRPIMDSIGEVSVRFGLATDFDPGLGVQTTVPIGIAADAGTKWDTAKWDSFKWAATNKTVAGWFAHEARGYAISPSVRVEQGAAKVSWNGTSIAYKRAGVT